MAPMAPALLDVLDVGANASASSRTSRMAGSTPFFKRPLTTSDPGKDQQGLGNLEPTC